MQSSPFSCPVTTKITRTRTPEGKLLNQYLIMQRIGQGPHAKIKLARDTKSGNLVAVKKFAMYLLKKKTRPYKDTDGKIKHLSIVEDIKREMKIAAFVQHENVVKMFEVLDDQDNGKLYFVMEYCENGDIASWNYKKQVFEVKKEYLELKRLKELCLDIVRGLKYLHSQGIVHRDLKPQNILIDGKGKAKIIDFGRAFKLESPEQRLKGSQGTYHFMAPEMLQEHDKNGYIGQLCDIWSFGVTLYCIAVRKLPFETQPLLKLFKQIQEADYQYPPQPAIPAPIKRTIDGVILKDPSSRLPLNDIQSILLE